MPSRPGRGTRIGFALAILTGLAIVLRMALPAEAQNSGPISLVSSPITVAAGSQIRSGVLNPTRRPMSVKFWVVDGMTGETQESELMTVNPGRTRFFTVSPTSEFSGVVQMAVSGALQNRRLPASVQVNDAAGVAAYVVDLSTDGGSTFPIN